VSKDAANVMRQAIAGCSGASSSSSSTVITGWNEHHSNPLHTGISRLPELGVVHMLNEDIISMPDKWEYPGTRPWDLAFHTLPLSIVDPDFAKEQRN